MSVYNFISFFGMFVLMAIAWAASKNRKNVNWSAVLWGILLQLLFAGFIFAVPAGTKLFFFVNDAVLKVLDSASAGAKFVFGRLAYPPGTVTETGEPSLGFMLAFQAFPTIIFFSAFMAVLYYYNVMSYVVRGFAWVFTRLMKISGAESLVAASNIFVGVEAALTIKPHLKNMTGSELCTVLTAGMASISSNVMALYVFTLHQQFPSIAGHLVSASILSAPAAILMSKLVYPEDEIPETLGKNIHPHYEWEKSLFEAVINGAEAGVKMIVGIVALLIAVLGLVALVDLLLGFAGGKINSLFCMNIDWSLRGLLGYLFYPVTLVLGVPLQDAEIISRIIGERLVVTEVAGYQDLAAALAGNFISSPRSAVIAAYALCGFAHLASVAIFVGGTAALVTEKKSALVKAAFRALLAATLATLITGCVAGIFFSGGSVLFGG